MKHNNLYQPSNGTEGMWFTETYCMNCFHCDPDPEGEKQCMILCNTMCYSVKDPEYPKEWCYDENNEPQCTKWQKWDWGKDGDPDDPDNPNHIPPDDPMQLCFPFILEQFKKEENGYVKSL